MSEETKKTVQEVVEKSKQFKTFLDDVVKKVAGGDKELVKKIMVVKEGAQKVIEHIEQRTEPKGG
jgi:uncharacterized protein YaaN involved in tellurite resistance